jgi:hypothetical protein
MSLVMYKLLHIVGILFLFIGLGGLLRSGGAAEGRKLAVMLHGIGLVVILVAGFGALARIGMSNPAIWPAWLWIKTVIWLLLGAAPAIIKRAPRLVPLLWVALPVLGGVAAYLALNNPA